MVKGRADKTIRTEERERSRCSCFSWRYVTLGYVMYMEVSAWGRSSAREMGGCIDEGWQFGCRTRLSEQGLRREIDSTKCAQDAAL